MCERTRGVEMLSQTLFVTKPSTNVGARLKRAYANPGPVPRSNCVPDRLIGEWSSTPSLKEGHCWRTRTPVSRVLTRGRREGEYFNVAVNLETLFLRCCQ